MQYNKFSVSFALFLIALVFTNNSSFAQSEKQGWTDYRGPNRNGYAISENIPLSWNDSTNIVWKTSIPGKGWSSPVVLNNKIWFTTALSDGKDLQLPAAGAESRRSETAPLD